MALGHALRAHRQRQRDRRQQTLGHERDRDADGEQEAVGRRRCRPAARRRRTRRRRRPRSTAMVRTTRSSSCAQRASGRRRLTWVSSAIAGQPGRRAVASTTARPSPSTTNVPANSASPSSSVIGHALAGQHRRVHRAARALEHVADRPRPGRRLGEQHDVADDQLGGVDLHAAAPSRTTVARRGSRSRRRSAACSARLSWTNANTPLTTTTTKMATPSCGSPATKASTPATHSMQREEVDHLPADQPPRRRPRRHAEARSARRGAAGSRLRGGQEAAQGRFSASPDSTGPRPSTMTAGSGGVPCRGKTFLRRPVWDLRPFRRHASPPQSCCRGTSPGRARSAQALPTRPGARSSRSTTSTSTVAPRRVRRVMGPSGSGKTTLLNCLSGLDDIDGGQVFVDGRDLLRDADAERTLHRAAVDGVHLPGVQPDPGVQRRRERRAAAAARAAARARRLAAARWRCSSGSDSATESTHRPNEMSGGEQQRVTIARALVGRPAIVWADEPTGQPRQHDGRRGDAALRELNEEEQQTIVLVTHDSGIGAAAGRVVRMRDGRLESDERREDEPAPLWSRQARRVSRADSASLVLLRRRSRRALDPHRGKPGAAPPRLSPDRSAPDGGAAHHQRFDAGNRAHREQPLGRRLARHLDPPCRGQRARADRRTAHHRRSGTRSPDR